MFPEETTMEASHVIYENYSIKKSNLPCTTNVASPGNRKILNNLTHVPFPLAGVQKYF